MDKRFGKRFTHWQALNQGGQAQLFRVHDTWTGKVCALKVATESPESRENLLHEFGLLSRLRHPCLIESLDLVWDEDGPGHLLEYVPLVAPDALWKAGGEEAVRAALIQAWRGLSYLHRQGLVHGDVSPGNILVWRDGADWRAKVADLGLVQAEEVAVLETSVRGTVDYLAPEVLRGEGGSSAADWFGLAATGVHWIDGESYWARLDPATAIRRMAEFEGGLKAGRPVSDDLGGVIEGWSSSAPQKRGSISIGALMGEDGVGFGPEVTAGSVHGLEEDVRVWTDAVLNEGVTLLVMKGRFGSGRRTVLKHISRGLSVEGWMDLGEAPAEVGRSWVREQGGRMDAVELSRAMLNQFEGSKVVVRWPARLSELEERVLRAFVAGRESNTVVLLAGPVEGEVVGESWLRTHLRVRDEVWVGPENGAMEMIAADLYAEEETRVSSAGHLREGRHPRAGGDPPALEGATPLSLEVGKLGGDAECGDELRAEAEAIWERVCVGCRRGLVLLAWGEQGYQPQDLEELIGQEGALEIESLLCIRSDYGAGDRRLMFTDALIQGAMTEFIAGEVDEGFLFDLGGILGTQPVELAIVSRFLQRGVFLEKLSLSALKEALAAGDYTGVLDYKKAYAARVDDAGEEWDKQFVDLFWEAARNIGRLPEEEELLRKQLEFGEDESQQRRLIEVLCALGNWQEAREECEIADQSDWTALKRLETIWQMGQFDEAEAEYELFENRWQELSEKNLLTYCVDRARLSSYKGDLPERETRLTIALERVEHLCESDMLFQNLYAGSRRYAHDWGTALDSYSNSADLAQRQHDWLGYVRARVNLASLRSAMGHYREARNQVKNSLSIAIATGSELLEARTSLTGAYAEAYSGYPSNALNRAQSVIAFGESVNDRGLITTSRSLQIITSVFYGLDYEIDDDVLLENDQISLRALQPLLQLDFAEAERFLVSKLEGFKSLSAQGEADCLKYLVECCVVQKRGDAPKHAERLRALDHVVGEAVDGINFLEWGFGIEGSHEPLMDSMKRFVDHERRFEFAYWGFHVLNEIERLPTSHRQAFKKSYLETIQTIADNFVSADQKRSFLSLPRIQKSLKLLSV